MKKISVFLAFIMVFGLFAAVNVSAAGAEPKLVYEPASMTYRPNENVELITAADGSSLNFGWHVTISTPEKDYSFDLSTNKGFSDFAAFDPNGKMKAKVNTQTQSNGRTVSTLTLEKLKYYDYGAFVYCVVKNAAGTKTTDKVELYPNENAPDLPVVEQLAELDLRVGKLLKFACNVYAPQGKEYDDVEYQWYTTPDGDKLNGEAITDENYSVLVVDTAKAGTYYFYCRIYIIKNSTDYIYESSVAEIRLHEPVMNVSYSSSSYDLAPGETAKIKANVTFEDSSEKGSLSYQWMSGDNNIAGTYTPVKGATSDTLTVTGANNAGKKYYCCIVTNELDGYTFTNNSSDIPITVVNNTGKSSAIINSEPKDTYVTEGDTATFSVDASKAKSYEWYMIKPGGNPVKLKNGSDGVISGADSASLKIKAAAENNGCMFYCNVYGADGNYTSTNNAKLNVNLIPPEQPVIKQHPNSVKADAGYSVALTVDAESPDGGELKYQWYSGDKAEYITIRAILNENDATLKLDLESGVYYYCVAVWNVKNGMENGPVYTDFAVVEIVGGTETGTDTGTDTGTETETDLNTETSVDTTETAANDTSADVTDTAAQTAEEGKDKVQTQNTLIIVLLIVLISLLVIAIAGAAVFMIIKNKKNKPAAEPELPEKKEPEEPKEETKTEEK